MPKYRLLTPGPVPVPERVRHAMAGTLLHHRAPEFIPLFHEVRAGLKRVFETEREVLLLTCSGTGAMEAAVANLTRRGDRVIVIRGGKFGERWAEICDAYGVTPICVDVAWGRSVDPVEVRAALVEHPDATCVFVQASETSTGALHPIEAISREVRDHSTALLVVDGISGVGVHPLPMDAWNIDALVSGSQKSWQLPPGLAFIALSERAEAALERSDHPRFYFDLRKELRGQPNASTAYSPALPLIVGLRESLRMMFEEGLERVHARHETLARMTRAAMLELGLELLAVEGFSHACTAVRVPDGIDAKKLLADLRDRHGITLAGGQGPLAGKIFRIGHMGDLDVHDMLTAISSLEMTLNDSGYPVELGAGCRKAVEVLRSGSPAVRV